MVCGGFSCSKNALAALNVLYILVAFILIGTAAYGKAVALIIDLSLMGGIIACGVFLLIIAAVGLIGAIKHNQVLLFFYMIVLFLLFLIQFAIAVACLAMNNEQQKRLATTGWKKASPTFKVTVQNKLKCCGFTDQGLALKDESGMGHPACEALPCCSQNNTPSKAACCSPSSTNSTATSIPCPCTNTCWNVAHQYMDQALKLAGGIGLFFSFTEIIGVWLALRFRNQKDPRANPSAFL